ncbi:ArsR/SmtB family transcription factor [Halorussus amylolyticus]|uniref:ArsR/SmtB family transcription factor n=1 Tax=Halorussus amylolyticus TaxID=1126242 RepID=UPI00138ED951|nr:winged helix-turn-helix domain-containing protein [Halorussus amylolyticus]
MAGLLPSSPDPSAGDGGDPRVIGVDSEDAADLLAALQSETAREILTALYDDPASPSALAETADTSIQNVRYHLEKLTDAELVEVADTVYSEKGREMKVYAPAAKPLVVFAGSDDDTPGVEAALSRLLGALGILGLSSVLVQRLFGGGTFAGEAGGGSDGGDFQGESLDETTTENANLSGGDDTGATTAADGDDSATTTADGDDSATTAADDGTATEAETVEEATEIATEEADAATTIAEETTQAATTVADAGGSADAMAGLPPGLVFFLGGAVVLAALGIAWYLRAR